MSISDVSPKDRCCGCEACVQACPVACITLRPDAEGFCYPSADATSCVSCGRCRAVCPPLSGAVPRRPLQAFVAFHADDAVRRASSSGGVFTLMAHHVLAAGGVVFGARFDGDWSVCHDVASTQAEVAAFRGSKYVQGRIGDAYRRVRDFLQQGRRVLFSGTPCQVQGLHAFLGKAYDHLLTVDFLCHGVPSPAVWQHYLRWHEASGGTVTRVNFRDKPEGWRRFHLSLLSEGRLSGQPQAYSAVFYDDAFMKVFLDDVVLRPSCYACPSKEGRAGSDVTLADCWGIDRLASEPDDDRGLSLVLLHTPQAVSLWPQLGARAQEVDVAAALASNAAWTAVPQPHELRSLYFRTYARQADFAGHVARLFHPSFGVRAVRKALRVCGVKQMPL